MAIIQVWVHDEDLKMLKEMKEYFEDEIEREFKGKAYFGWSERKHRPKVNDSYIVCRAIWELHTQIKNTLEQERREKQANARTTYVTHGFSKRNDEQVPERRWGRKNQE